MVRASKLPARLSPTSGAERADGGMATVPEGSGSSRPISAHELSPLSRRSSNSSVRSIASSTAPLISGMEPLRVGEDASAAVVPPEEQLRHLAQLSNVVDRHMFHRSVTPQYRYAKDDLTTENRTILSGMLMEVMKGKAEIAGLSSADAPALWAVLQEARLRTHTPAQHEAFEEQRKKTIGKEVGMWTFCLLMPPLIPIVALVNNTISPARRVSLLTPFGAAGAVKADRRAYDRDPARPEYYDANRAFIDALADAELPDAMKRRIFDTLVAQARAKTLTPRDSDALALALGVPANKKGKHHEVLHLPKVITDDMFRKALRSAEEAKRSAREIELTTPETPDDEAELSEAPPGRVVVTGSARDYSAIKPVSALQAGFVEYETQCAIAMKLGKQLTRNLTYRDKPLLLLESANSEKGKVCTLVALDQLVSQGRLLVRGRGTAVLHPFNPEVRLTHETLHLYARRIVPDKPASKPGDRTTGAA